MRNTNFSSVSPRLYNFGNNEAQMPNLDISMQVDSIITNVHRNDFSMDSRLFKEDNQIKDVGFALSCQSLINNYQQDFQANATSYNNVSQQSSSLFNRKRSLPQFDVDFESPQNARTRAIKTNDLLSQENTIHVLACYKTALNASKKANKQKIIKVNSSCEEQWRQHIKLIEEHRVPARRSQKLSDKITALQKLVSPYGKTDTASVLQEASLYIKLLQEQIQMLSSSYTSVRTPQSQEVEEEEQLDLRSRGLCLVPMAFTQSKKGRSA